MDRIFEMTVRIMGNVMTVRIPVHHVQKSIDTGYPMVVATSEDMKRIRRSGAQDQEFVFVNVDKLE